MYSSFYTFNFMYCDIATIAMIVLLCIALIAELLTRALVPPQEMKINWATSPGSQGKVDTSSEY